MKKSFNLKLKCITEIENQEKDIKAVYKRTIHQNKIQIAKVREIISNYKLLNYKSYFE
jgi:hypothetical protein